MKKIQSLEDLNRFKEKAIETRKRKGSPGNIQLVVSLGSCGIAAGALDTLSAIREQAKTDHVENLSISQAGCAGLCRYEPIVEVVASDDRKVTYGHVTPEVARRILREHILDGRIVEEFVVEV